MVVSFAILGELIAGGIKEILIFEMSSQVNLKVW